MTFQVQCSHTITPAKHKTRSFEDPLMTGKWLEAIDLTVYCTNLLFEINLL